MKEIWKDIKDYEGLYQISTLGRVRSLDRFVHGIRASKMLIRGRVLKNQKYPNGYYYVTLYKGGFGKTAMVHRLVALGFVDNPFNFPIINHKDEGKSNNCLTNLEWCTYAYNTRYGGCIEKMKLHRDSVSAAKKHMKKIKQIGDNGIVIEIWNSETDAEIFFRGRLTSNISKCLRKKQGRAYGFRWEYAVTRT